MQDLHIFVHLCILWCAGGVQQGSVDEPQRWGAVGDRPSRARCLASVETCCSLLPSCPMEVRARNELSHVARLSLVRVWLRKTKEWGGEEEGKERRWRKCYLSGNEQLCSCESWDTSLVLLLSLLVFLFLVPPLGSLFCGPSFPPHLTLSLPLHQATL